MIFIFSATSPSPKMIYCNNHEVGEPMGVKRKQFHLRLRISHSLVVVVRPQKPLEPTTTANHHRLKNITRFAAGKTFRHMKMCSSFFCFFSCIFIIYVDVAVVVSEIVREIGPCQLVIVQQSLAAK